MSLPSFRPSSQSGPYPGVGQGLPPKFPQRHPSLSNGGTTSNSGAAAGTAGGSNNIATGSNSLQSPPPPSSARLNPINFPFNLSSSGLPSGEYFSYWAQYPLLVVVESGSSRTRSFAKKGGTLVKRSLKLGKHTTQESIRVLGTITTILTPII